MVFLEELGIFETLAHSFFDDFHSVLGHGRRENEWRAGQTEIAEHGHYLAFPLGFGEAIYFRQIRKLRMFIFSRHSEDDMKIDETFFQPFCLAIQQPTVGYGDGIDLATHQSDSPLRIRKAGDIPNFFEPEEPSHDPADVVVAMANGLSTHTYARGLPTLFHGCPSRPTPP